MVNNFIPHEKRSKKARKAADAAMVACAGHWHSGLYGRSVIDFLFGISNQMRFEIWNER